MNKILEAKNIIGLEEIDENKLNSYFSIIEAKVRNYCHIPYSDSLHVGLQWIIIEMVSNYYYLVNLNSNANENNGPITSIKRGDTTISYGSGSKISRSENNIDEFISDYYRQLWTFRRVARLK